LYGLSGAQSGGEGGSGGGYDDACSAFERDFIAAKRQQRHAEGWRRGGTRNITALIGAG